MTTGENSKPSMSSGGVVMVGRHVYGAASMVLGILGFATADFANYWHPVPEGIAYRRGLAYAAAALMFAAGAGLQWRKTTRAALLLSASVYTPFALLWLRRVIGLPHLSGTWSGFAEQLAPVIAALFAYSRLAGTNARWSPKAAAACRAAFGLCVVGLGLAHFFALAITASLVPKWIPPGPHFWAAATGVALVLAGVSIAIDVQSARAARLLTVLLLVFGAFVWAPRLFSHPHRPVAWGGFAITMLVCGAAWMVADRLDGAPARDGA
ncbi:MAG: hypothetical protein ABIQ52_05530 [Vicinamibacterales bacterium]